MEREYEIFERLPDNSLMWHDHATGLPKARNKLREIAQSSGNECFAIHLESGEIVARCNVGASGREFGKPSLFQIGYDEPRARTRSQLLRARGYDVVSVIGNEAAKVILTLPSQFDMFIVGHNAPEPDRREMVAWLKEKFPRARVLALNRREIRELDGADYNVELNGPEVWLSIVNETLGPAHGGPGAARTC
jgi:hypothetical protein